MTEFNPEQREAMRLRYMAVDTSNVADVLDTMGYLDQGLSPEFAPFPSSSGQIAGWAHTIRGQMTPYELGGDADKMKACQALAKGEISVWSGDGEGICYFGELIAIGMKERGCAGSLVDGGVRDLRWIGDLGFPVFARYRTPVQSIGRWKVTASQVPVYMRGARGAAVIVRPGDFILGDADGVIAIPHEVALEVLVEAEKLTKIEVSIRAELKKGLSLAEALAKFGHV